MSLIVTPRVRIQETCMNLRAVPDNSNMTVQVQKEKIESVVADYRKPKPKLFLCLL